MHENDATNHAPRLEVVVEYMIGHATFADRLRDAAAAHPRVRAHHRDLRWGHRGLVERLPLIRSNWSLRSSLRSRMILERARDPDAALIHTQTASLLSAGYMQRVPTVISSDATPRQFDAMGTAYGHATGSRAAEALKAAVVARAYRSSTTIIAWTDWVRRSIVKDYGAAPEKVVSLHPGTDLPEMPRHDSDGPPRILFVGGDFERKGGKELVSAVSGLGVPCRLDVVTRDAVEAPPEVRVHRDLAAGDDQLERLYAEADLFVFPTRGDAVPFAIVEAMAAGLPVISTPVGAIEDLIDDDGAILVPPDDARSLRTAIETVLTDAPRRRGMAAAARGRAERHFDARTNSRRILDITAAAAAA
jgi:glycosyltransferase involved in cell wall biosynthesis